MTSQNNFTGSLPPGCITDGRAGFTCSAADQLVNYHDSLRLGRMQHGPLLLLRPAWKSRRVPENNVTLFDFTSLQLNGRRCNGLLAVRSLFSLSLFTSQEIEEVKVLASGVLMVRHLLVFLYLKHFKWSFECFLAQRCRLLEGAQNWTQAAHRRCHTTNC